MPIGMGAAFIVSALLGTGGGIARGVAGGKDKDKDRQLTRDLADQDDERLRDLAKENNLTDRDIALLSSMLDESKRDPFRHDVAQSDAMTLMDRRENQSYTPVKLEAPAMDGTYAGSIPNVTGGYEYRPSDKMQSGQGHLLNKVMSGQGAPNITGQMASAWERPGADLGSPQLLDLLKRMGIGGPSTGTTGA